MSDYSASNDGESLPAPVKPPRKAAKSKAWHKQAEASRREPFNPLDLENLGRSMEAELLTRKPEPLADIPPVYGSGIYALYYCGPNPLYQEISQPECLSPIYVGQARPEGVRKGAKTKGPGVKLWDRLFLHRRSIEQVHDLDVADFKVRYLVSIEAFVSLAERVMISHYRPVWNSVVDGFGNNDPGANRRKTGARPPWDELHPGRWWSHPQNMPTPSNTPANVSRARVRALLEDKLTDSELEAIAEEFDSQDESE
ncbi:Eco29kI family restriction endonuclease [Streptomyces sp. NPDC094034]|uniref:Eco29kI family restriction endonuclease n=1 Tax=Streptomyces sp. NPDC094034 TaxID=3155309 RepID=UPI0033325E7C